VKTGLRPCATKTWEKRKEDPAGKLLAEEYGKKFKGLLPCQPATNLLDSEDWLFHGLPLGNG
jgi:hypothetical protein